MRKKISMLRSFHANSRFRVTTARLYVNITKWEKKRSRIYSVNLETQFLLLLLTTSRHTRREYSDFYKNNNNNNNPLVRLSR